MNRTTLNRYSKDKEEKASISSNTLSREESNNSNNINIKFQQQERQQQFQLQHPRVATYLDDEAMVELLTAQAQELLCFHVEADMLEDMDLSLEGEHLLDDETGEEEREDDINLAELIPAAYHELYLQRDPIEYMSPVAFEDGMDYEECVLYYACQHAQMVGGTVRQIRGPTSHRRQAVCPDALFKNSLRSCLRKSRYSTSTLEEDNSSEPSCTPPTPPVSLRRMRRFSFTGTPVIAEPCPFLFRSNSMPQEIVENNIDNNKDGDDTSSNHYDCQETVFHPNNNTHYNNNNTTHNTTKVAFEEYVHVVCIYSFRDYPKQVRSRMWMSRREMQKSIQRVKSEEWYQARVQRKEQARRTRAAQADTATAATALWLSQCQPQKQQHRQPTHQQCQKQQHHHHHRSHSQQAPKAGACEQLPKQVFQEEEQEEAITTTATTATATTATKTQEDRGHQLQQSQVTSTCESNSSSNSNSGNHKPRVAAVERTLSVDSVIAECLRSAVNMQSAAAAAAARC